MQREMARPATGGRVVEPGRWLGRQMWENIYSSFLQVASMLVGIWAETDIVGIFRNCLGAVE